MKILYTGPLSRGETCQMRQAALERIGHHTIGVDYLPLVRASGGVRRAIQWRLRLGPMIDRYNEMLIGRLSTNPDVFWVDKGMFVRREVLLEARRRGVRFLVHYSPDNYFLAQNASRHFRRGVVLYDLVVTTKREGVEQLRAQGARAVLLSGNAFDPRTHRPVALSADERCEYQCDVSFIGRWEPEREAWLERVADLGVRLSIRGPGWQQTKSPAVRRAIAAGPTVGNDYAKAICGAKVNLAFLSRLAGDQITQRSVEIPACAGFMLAERTHEHLAHFAEGMEAAYFAGTDEMCSKILYYLAHDEERQRIAAAARVRCLTSRYTYEDRLREILAALQPSQ